MQRFIRTLTVAAALAAPAAASAYDFGGPVMPPPGGYPLVCQTADLAANIVEVLDYGYGGWRWIGVEVSNEGAVGFEAGPGQAAILLTVGESSALLTRDIRALAAGATTYRGAWVQLPGYAAPDGEPAFGQCPAEATVAARVSYDPDLALDGDPAHRDCRSGNDLDTVGVPYLVGCPW